MLMQMRARKGKERKGKENVNNDDKGEREPDVWMKRQDGFS